MSGERKQGKEEDSGEIAMPSPHKKSNFKRSWF